MRMPRTRLLPAASRRRAKRIRMQRPWQEAPPRNWPPSAAWTRPGPVPGAARHPRQSTARSWWPRRHSRPLVPGLSQMARLQRGRRGAPRVMGPPTGMRHESQGTRLCALLPGPRRQRTAMTTKTSKWRRKTRRDSRRISSRDLLRLPPAHRTRPLAASRPSSRQLTRPVPPRHPHPLRPLLRRLPPVRSLGPRAWVSGWVSGSAARRPRAACSTCSPSSQKQKQPREMRRLLLPLRLLPPTHIHQPPECRPRVPHHRRSRPGCVPVGRLHRSRIPETARLLQVHSHRLGSRAISRAWAWAWA